MAGLSSTGLVILTADEIKTELEAALKTAFGDSIDLDPSGPYGQLVGILADRESDLWELLVAVKEAFNPDGATGVQLDELAALTGTVRDGATGSTAVITALGDVNTIIPAASVVSTDSTSVEFSTDVSATLVAPASWAATTNYVVQDRVLATTRIYEATVSGTSSSSEPTGETSAETDGTVTWKYLGTSAAVADVNVTAVETGPSVALSGDITVIETPISGWDSVLNLEDATLGRNEETDAELRVKRVTELSSGSTSTYGGVFAAVSDVENVSLVYIFENNTSSTDADGVPAKAFETLVVGGLDDDLAVAIFHAKPLGIQPFGTTTVNLTDSQGTVQTVGFTRPVDINVYVTINVVVDPYQYPLAGDTLIRDAILTLNTTTKPGKDVVSSKIKSLVHTVDGVLDVTTAYIGTSASPASEATIAIALRELADYDSSRIIINSTDGTP